MSTGTPSVRGAAAAASRARASADGRGVPAASGVAVLLGYMAVAATLAALSLEPPLATPLGPVVALTLAGLATLAISRRTPTLAFVLALALTPVSFAFGTGAEAFLVPVLLYRAGVERGPRAAWVGYGITAAVGVVGAIILAFRIRLGPPLLGLSLRRNDEWVIDVVTFVAIIAGVALVATLFGVNAGHQRRHVAALEERAEKMKRERDQQATNASAAERERIAREMHDVIAHSLAVMIALADGAEASADRRPEESKRAIARVGETGRRTLGEVRRLLASVRGDDASDPGERPAAPGVEQLPALVEEFRAAGLPIRLETTGVLARDPVVGFTIYRIVQESLTNVLRHARGVREVLVRIDLGADEITILVEDASGEAPAALDPGRGLVGIRERAAFYDGVVETGPRPEGGWRVFVRLPVEDR